MSAHRNYSGIAICCTKLPAIFRGILRNFFAVFHNFYVFIPRLLNLNITQFVYPHEDSVRQVSLKEEVVAPKLTRDEESRQKRCVILSVYKAGNIVFCSPHLLNWRNKHYHKCDKFNANICMKFYSCSSGRYWII